MNNPCPPCPTATAEQLGRDPTRISPVTVGDATLYHGDNRAVLASLPECSVDSIVTDPPYGLTQGKRGGSGEASVNLNTPHGRARVTTGFMGMAWDGAVPGVEFWTAMLRVAKPGAHLLAFGGTRTFHRMACAIEDAGWEIRDTIMWVYGSGFPKSLNLDGEWDGWGTALKPAWEPIIVARKSLDGTVAANVAKWGTGAMNIDGCRVGNESRHNRPVGAHRNSMMPYEGKDGPGTDVFGRWPANVIHDGSEEVLAEFPDAPGQQGDLKGTEPSRTGVGTACYGEFKERREFKARRDGEASANSANAGAVGFNMKPGMRRDAASAARFFYCAKASREDRNEGCEDMPRKALNWSAGEQNPGSFQSEGTDKTLQNHHPTVKPTDLMRYLCRLVTPPKGIVLDPFMGSGSTGKAALLEGFRFIGMELSHEYLEIAKARIQHAANAHPLFAGVA